MSNKTLTLGQAAAWCGGQIAPELEERPFFGANFDSRLIRPGELFAALPGARDGHDFAASALELLPPRTDGAILTNIIYYGLPAVLHSVAEGTFCKRSKK